MKRGAPVYAGPMLCSRHCRCWNCDLELLWPAVAKWHSTCCRCQLIPSNMPVFVKSVLQASYFRVYSLYSVWICWNKTFEKCNSVVSISLAIPFGQQGFRCKSWWYFGVTTKSKLLCHTTRKSFTTIENIVQISSWCLNTNRTVWNTPIFMSTLSICDVSCQNSCSVWYKLK